MKSLGYDFSPPDMNSPCLRPSARRARPFFAATFVALFLPATAPAAFHEWRIRELYTNLDGSVQFIEMFTSSSGQEFTGSQTIQVTEQATGMSHIFTFPTDTPTPTNNHAILIATSNLTLFGGPTPNFILPFNFLFSGASTLEFFGTNQGAINYPGLPTNGMLSLVVPGNTTQLNSPQNYAGMVGVVPEPTTWGLLGLGGLGLCFLLRRRAA